MYLPAKFCDHRSHRSRNVNNHFSYYVNISEKAEITASIYHIERFSKSQILIYSSKVMEKSLRWKKTKGKKDRTITILSQVLKEIKLLTKLHMKDDITKNIKILKVECSDRGDWRSTVTSMMFTRLMYTIHEYAVKKKMNHKDPTIKWHSWWDTLKF